MNIKNTNIWRALNPEGDAKERSLKNRADILCFSGELIIKKDDTPQDIDVLRKYVVQVMSSR